MALKFSGFGIVILSSLTLLIIPTAMGCSELCSNALESLKISSVEYSCLTDSTLVTPKSPFVNVPVLSKRRADILRDSSKAVLLRINNPF